MTLSNPAQLRTRAAKARMRAEDLRRQAYEEHRRQQNERNELYYDAHHDEWLAAIEQNIGQCADIGRMTFHFSRDTANEVTRDNQMFLMGALERELRALGFGTYMTTKSFGDIGSGPTIYFVGLDISWRKS